MNAIDPRIREEHIAKYGATEDVLAYLSVLENLPVVSDDDDGENHHMLAKSIWPQYANLKGNPWNRLKIHRGVHKGLTEVQSWFEESLRVALLFMKGQSTEAYLAACSRGGTIGGKKNVESGHLARINVLQTAEQRSKAGRVGGKIAATRGVGIHALTPEQRSANGRKGGTIAGRIAAASGHLDRIRTREGSIKGGRIGGKINGRKNVESGHLARICSAGGKAGGKISGRMNVESGQIRTIATPESCSSGGKKMHQLHPETARDNCKRNNCLRWNVRRDKPCICGHHQELYAE